MEHVSRVSGEMSHGLHPAPDTLHRIVEADGDPYSHIVQFSGEEGVPYHPADAGGDPTETGLIYIRE